MFAERLPQVPVTSLWQLLERAGLPPGARKAAGLTLAIHDPCTTRPFPEIQEAVRRIVTSLGVSVEELALSRDLTECCGFGGLMQNANPELAQEVVARRARMSATDYLAYCAMCRDSLAAAGKRTLHLLDLVFPGPASVEPAQRPRPGWSERQDNRVRLRTRLLESLEKETAHPVQAHEGVSLIIAPEIAQMLEKRRILVEDIQRVIHHAQQSGCAVVHPRTQRVKACHRPYRATVWVEYTPTPEGYVVHSAYTHRMEIVGGQSA
jgi:glutamate synthase (NADPH) small chain